MSVSETRHIALPKPRPRMPRWISGLLEWVSLPIIVIALWSLSASIAPNPRFSAPVSIWDAFVTTWLNDTFFVDVVPSLARLGLGIVIAIVAGIAFGILIGSVKWLREFFEPMLEFFRAVPPPMIVPVLVMLLGANDSMKVIVIASGAVWPILLNTIEGVRATDQVQRETVTSFRMPMMHRLWFVTLPSASPQIMTGIRQSLSVALILMVIAEMFLASSGLGYQIVVFQQNYQYAEMWSIILLLGLAGLLLAILFQIAERFVLAWYRGLKGAERA